ncbi:MAG TPA: EF-hand domain-containing protein [Rhodocyclaceae bacterium]|jgi:Ca2+-binding EF-hand superfamily protein|nr:EF-hand domain-containing protein [Rhodocyclaceae bacterium]
MSSISSIGSNAMMMYGSSRSSTKANALAEELFAKIDSNKQGYIEKSDLQSAISGTDNDSDVDALFSQLDSDGDGKVTEDEFTNVLSQLNQQFDQMRMQGGMPPPPPPQGQDSGFTKDELTAQLEEIGSSDSKRSSLISNIVNNFDAADSDGDGKVTFQEAMAFDQSSNGTSTGTSSTSSSDGSSSAGSTSASSDDSKLMLQIMRLMQAYHIGESDSTAQFSALA